MKKPIDSPPESRRLAQGGSGAALSSTRPGSGQDHPADRGSAERPRILIVDDEQSMREWMRLLFQRDGFEVLTAEDGVAAREMVTRDYVDVVLTDIRMPRLDGVQLLKAIRELPPTPSS